MKSRHFSIDQADRFARDALMAAGAGEAAAREMAKAIVAAEIDGTTSHGFAYLPTYCTHLRCGKVNASAQPVVDSPADAAIVVDADSGFAHPAIDAGFGLLVDRASRLGCAGMSVRNSYNCGVLGYHVERLARKDLLGLGFTNAPASIAPVGGDTPVIGTNPFALSVPDGHGGAAFTLDQSASVVAKSEIMMRARAGEPIEPGWALDADGNPTTDANAALAGSMAPSGGYKGFGVGLMVEIFAAALAGATLGVHASPFSGTSGGPPRTGQFFLALDPGRFSGGVFAQRVEALCAAIESQGGARLPGARRRASRPLVREKGITLAEELLSRIEAAARGV